MPIYEHVFLARQNATAKQVETMAEIYKGVIEANGGKVEKIEMWGVKSLAYRIKKNRKAHFTLLNVDAPPEALAEMERQMMISEDILRFMTVRVEELDAEPWVLEDKKLSNVLDRVTPMSSAYSDLLEENSDVNLDHQFYEILNELRTLNNTIEERLEGQKFHERGDIKHYQERSTDNGGSETPRR